MSDVQLCQSPSTCQHTAIMDERGWQVGCGPEVVREVTPCDHSDHQGAVVRATRRAEIGFTDGAQTVRALCHQHSLELTRLWRRGADAWGHIHSVAIEAM